MDGEPNDAAGNDDRQAAGDLAVPVLGRVELDDTHDDHGVMLTGRGARLPQWEQLRIVEIAEREGVDPCALAAMRITENGGGGREFGVLDARADTYDKQVEWAARTIKNTMTRYRNNIHREPLDDNGRLTAEFLAYLSKGGPGYPGYAPTLDDFRGAPKIPPPPLSALEAKLNPNHAGNLLAAYQGTTLG